MKAINTLPAFVASLDARQKAFFLTSLAVRERELQAAVLDLSRGVGTVGQLLSNDTLTRLTLDAGS
jgi:hypothetical protein